MASRPSKQRSPHFNRAFSLRAPPTARGSSESPASKTTDLPARAAPVDPTSVGIEQQIACAKRELAMRKNVYPRLVGGKRMTQFKADDEIAAMAAIVKTLESLPKEKSNAPD